MHFIKRAAVAALAVLPGFVSTLAVPKPKAGDIIPDQYIVVLKEGISSATFLEHQDWASRRHTAAIIERGEAPPTKTFKYTYDSGNFKGYAGKFDKATINEISARDEVEYIEPDKVVATHALTTQAPAGWNLAAISHLSCMGNNYIYDTTAGAGTYVYVIDTGVNIQHSQFGGHAVWGYNAVDSNNTDGLGHGTHVAGIIGSTIHGVAKKTQIIAVKVLAADGSGTTSGVIAGINYVVQHVANNARTGKAIANMSLGGSFSAALNGAVNNAVSAGVLVTVSAGNDNANSANYSPASAASAITVASTQQDGARASSSNYGAVVDIFAPGRGITSTWIGSTTATMIMSGTSMAAPHVAGLAAYLIPIFGLTTPDAVAAKIFELSVACVTGVPEGTTDRFINNGNGVP